MRYFKICRLLPFALLCTLSTFGYAYGKSLLTQKPGTNLVAIGASRNNSLPQDVAKLSAKDFDTWVQARAGVIGTEKQKPIELETVLLRRLRADKFTTDDAIMLVVGMWTNYDLALNATSLGKNSASSSNEFPNTFKLIDLLLPLTYGRLILSAKLVQQKADLYGLSNSYSNVAEEYSKAIAILTPLQLILEIQRMKSLVSAADALYALHKIQQSESLYLTVLSDDNYPVVEDPKLATSLEELYISAGKGLINVRGGNLTALHRTFFFPSSLDELQPYLNAAIADAERRSGKSNVSGH